MAGQRGINIPNFSALNQFVDPMAQAGKFAAEYGNRVRADERYQAEQARLKVLDDRQAQQWEKSFAIQEAQDKRAGTEFDRKLLGQNMMSHIDAATADVMTRGALTQAGQGKLLSEYDRLVKSGMNPQDAGVRIGQMYDDPNQKGIRQVPMTLKDKIRAVEGINLGSGELQYDPTMALGQKDKLLTQLRSEYENELNRQQQIDLAKMDIAAREREGAKDRAHATKLASAKDTPITMYKLLPDGRYVTQKVTTESMMNKLHSEGYSVGDVGGSYKPEGSNNNGGTPVVPLRTGIGSWDDQRLAGVATVLQTAGLSNKDAIGLANMAAEDKLHGTGVNFNKILEPTYQKLKAKDSSITKQQVAELLNTAF